MNRNTQAVAYDVDRIVRLLSAAGLPSDSADRVAPTFDTGVKQTLDQLFDTADYLLDTRGAIVLSVLGAILLRRAGVNSVALAPDLAAAAEEWDRILGEDLYEPFFDLDAPADPPAYG
jgi:hypothetical protein